MKIMKIIGERERYEKEVEILTNTLIWLVVVYDFISDLIGPLFLSTTLLAIFFFFFSSAGSSGISGFWLFWSDHFMFLWGLTAFTTIVNRSSYIMEYHRSANTLLHPQSHNNEIPISTELRGIDDDIFDVGDVSKEFEKMKELMKELREDEKKMDIEMEFMEHAINTGLETHRENLSVKLLELREELKDDGDKMRTYMELMENFVNSELVTLRDYVSINVDESWEDLRVDVDIKDLIDDVNFVGDEVHETYLVIKETAKAAKITADRANLTYLVTQEIIDEFQNMRCMIKAEDHEDFVELREEVMRMSLDSEARRMEAEVMAERAAEELSSAMEELVEAFEIRQWEDYKTE